MVSDFELLITGKIKPDNLALVREYQLFVGLRDLVSKLDLGCNLAAGQCANGNPDCCVECGALVGEWIKFLLQSELGTYLDGYSETDGFHDGDGGCLLPYNLRPLVCTRYLCDAAHANLDPVFLSGIIILFSVMKDLEDILVKTEVRDE